MDFQKKGLQRTFSTKNRLFRINLILGSKPKKIYLSHRPAPLKSHFKLYTGRIPASIFPILPPIPPCNQSCRGVHL